MASETTEIKVGQRLFWDNQTHTVSSVDAALRLVNFSGGGSTSEQYVRDNMTLVANSPPVAKCNFHWCGLPLDPISNSSAPVYCSMECRDKEKTKAQAAQASSGVLADFEDRRLRDQLRDLAASGVITADELQSFNRQTARPRTQPAKVERKLTAGWGKTLGGIGCVGLCHCVHVDAVYEHATRLSEGRCEACAEAAGVFADMPVTLPVSVAPKVEPWKCWGRHGDGEVGPCRNPSAPKYLDTLMCVVCADRYHASMMSRPWHQSPSTFVGDIVPAMPVRKIRPEYLRHDWRDSEWIG